jgi:putative membrane protein
MLRVFSAVLRTDSEMIEQIPYCGTPPSPGELLSRFNLDPALILALLALAFAHVSRALSARTRAYAVAGWSVAALALISPLCALSVSLFAARIAQHMLLLLGAAPLIALALPRTSAARGVTGLWLAATAFLFSLWFWHMPKPYDATFTSTTLYWLMHSTLFGSAIMLWRELLHHAPERAAEALIVATFTSLQMSLLGAVLTLASAPLFYSHLLTTQQWGLSPLEDQELGGVLMWVPGMLLFVWTALRSLWRLWSELEATRAG